MNKYFIKRSLSSLTGLLGNKWKNLPAGVYVFNYHRIGDSKETQFDPNLFSCDEEHFAAQIEVIASRFKIINVEQLVDLIVRQQTPSEPLAMITFDDGYADNYNIALPILKSLNATAAFFLPTDFIDSAKIPWWDEAAWLVRNSSRESIKLQSWDNPIQIDYSNVFSSIRQVLRKFKDQSELTMEDKLLQLKDACACEVQMDDAASLFVTWDQVREMNSQGMDIGSHTFSHNILSHLSRENQKEELLVSKNIIEEQIGETISAFAYPVGGLDSFTQETIQIAKECGYSVAFTSIIGGGYNHNPMSNPFELVRISAEGRSSSVDIKYSAAFASRM